MSTDSVVSKVGPRAAFESASFRLYISSRFLANLAAEMLNVAVGWQVYAITHRAIDLGYVGLVQFVPAFFLSLPAGHVADRVSRARIVALSNLGLAVCALGLLASSIAMPLAVTPIYVVLFLAGVARTFGAPAGQALVPMLVPSAHFANAVSWNSTAWQTATLVGPSLGGLLYGVTGNAVGAYAVCSALLVAAAAVAFAIRPASVAGVAAAAKPGGATLHSVLAGLRYVRDNPVVLGTVSMDLFAVLLGGATALLPIFASDVLHIGPFGLGVLRSAPAVGAAGMAVFLAYRPLGGRAGRTMLVSVAVFGLATIVFGLSRSFALSLLALVVLGASDMVSVVIRGTVVQLRTPHEMRGRVSAVNSLFISTSSQLGELESGLTAAWFGAVPAAVLGGLGTIAVVAVYAIVFPTLRAIDRLDAPA